VRLLTTLCIIRCNSLAPKISRLLPGSHDVDKGGHYDARSAAINIWSHHWLHPATQAESETLGTFYFHWEPPALWEIETDEGFSLEDLMDELGRLELAALGCVKHGDVP
jgi:hypothetical protein